MAFNDEQQERGPLPPWATSRAVMRRFGLMVVVVDTSTSTTKIQVDGGGRLDKGDCAQELVVKAIRIWRLCDGLL